MTEKPRKGSLNKRMYVCMYVCMYVSQLGLAVLEKKFFFRPFGPQLVLNITGGGGGPSAPSLDPQLLTLLFLDLTRLMSLEIKNH